MTTDRDVRMMDAAAGPDRTAAAARDLGSARVLLGIPDAEEHGLIAATCARAGFDTVVIGVADELEDGLRDHAVDVVILDAELARVETATTILRQRRYADLPLIVVGDDADPGGSPPGSDLVVGRPVEPQALIDGIRSALRTRRALLGMETAHTVVASLANELLAPETDVRLHTERLGTYAAELGRRAGLSASDLTAVAYGTLLHDLAKLGIAEWILLKPGPLTDEERRAMQRHTEIGARIAASIPGGEHVGPVIRHHHERWDGTGYPDGLAASAIPMGARIISVVDAFDAMTQYRVYRSPMRVPDAVAELEREKGAQFDPDLVDTFIDVLRWDGLI